MESTASSPGPRRMQIASGLGELRGRAGLTQEEVGKRADVSKATVSRYEDWRNRARIRWGTVKLLAEACGGSPQEVDALVQLAQDTQEGWWVGDTAVPEWMNPLVSLEHEAAYEHVFANAFVPGLLQTRAYALAVHQAEAVRTSNEEVERMVEARMLRQSVLSRESPLHLWAIIDQAVLARVVGEHGVMAEQLDHLCEQARQPNIDIQVLPFTSGAHAAGVGHFVALGNTDETLRVVYVETLGGGLYLDGEAEVTRYKVAFDYLRSQAVDTTASAKILATARKEHR